MTQPETPVPDIAAVAGKLSELEWQLYALVPPLDPPALHWLDSDATYSYCWPCARKARWHEMGNVGEPPAESDWWNRDPIEENIRSGIDGGFDSASSDTPESCEICGCTLQHTLTDYGVSAELSHFAENPGFVTVGPEDSYVISRICMNLTWDGADEQEVAAATKIVEDALSALRQHLLENGGG